MSIVYLSYLRYVCLSKLDINGPSDFKTLIDKCPLAIYSAWFWTNHARLVDHEKVIQNRSLEMLQQTEFNKMWPALITAIHMWDENPVSKTNSASASGAQQKKFNNTVQMQFAADKVKYRAPGKEAPLYIASAAGMQNVVHLLLKADENPIPGKYLGALEVAALNGPKAVVESLLILEPMMATPREYLALALKNASCGGHDEIVELLLHHRAPTNLERYGYGTTI
jgi:ankyrin repeat protein